uniref:Heparan-alpha-glucosaminide N-acetyltransferase n=1 Tax=Cacopsylla melanoneura TaxID=428564 RepID=A0A8D8SVA0_9HEMI
MIFVNFGAGQYQFLDHAAWNGLNLADLVFPWFLWIMGVTIPIVMSSNLRKNVSRHQIFLQIIKRSAILFVFNLMLNTFTYNGNLATIRINGVLQRFATTYLVVAGFAAYFTFQSDSGENSLLPSFVKDITLLLPQWFIHSTILCLHGWVTFHLQMPGCPRSSSFMFLTSGISFVLLSILYIAIDHFNVWDGSPFFYAGMNPTLLYVGHNIAVMFPFIWHISPNNTHFQSMGQNLWTVLLWILIAKWLHYKRYFYSV